MTNQRKSFFHQFYYDPSLTGENILMVSRNGGGYQAVLADFGLAINASSSEYNRGVLEPRGTIRYRSPEVCKFTRINVKFWLYADCVEKVDNVSAPGILGGFKRRLRSTFFFDSFCKIFQWSANNEALSRPEVFSQ